MTPTAGRSSVATTAYCGAARGPSHRARSARRSATGTTRCAGRSSPGSGWPGTPDVPTPRLAGRAAVAARAGARPAVRPAGAVLRTAPPGPRAAQRRRLGRGLLAGGWSCEWAPGSLALLATAVVGRLLRLRLAASALAVRG